MMKVIHLSVECYPVAKVGGLADVVGALPKYQRTMGIDASVVMPWYDRPFLQNQETISIATGNIKQGDELFDYEVLKEKNESLGFPLYFIRIPGKLDRPEVYCYPDEAEQWIAFQHAFLDFLNKQEALPDVVHCHDHHVGLTPFLMQHGLAFRERLAAITTIFTVHNGQYQGWIDWNKSPLLPAYDDWKWGLLEWNEVINPMAAAIKCCAAYNTVSEGYLQELFEEANGLQDLFKMESGKAEGIVNGIDETVWNPETDSSLDKNYGVSTVRSGKNANKKWLGKAYGVDFAKPLIVFIGRFAFEKGADLLPVIIDEIFANTDEDFGVFILGSGDEEISAQLEARKSRYEGRLATFFGYNEELAHRVYAAADLLLMPSRVEPCGLNQLYAMKYGTIPIVRNTGGLRDTVMDVATEGGYGFVFDEANPTDAANCVVRALDILQDKKKLDQIRKKIMKLNYSWEQSALKYEKLYNRFVEEKL
ncbi:glycogen synthase [Sphingobacterium corticibacter]|uniref:Glycogen synthase n=1 Tax=Sphingobacterium corticibacter TaxID=2171749 RepID=A0A2T8HIB5_9SPHI|nr:glycogen/starch synthase [Sphingobacterium corticibacter]PVH25171.1 glycogen synthase [Sphingobacterium corticibacter]